MDVLLQPVLHTYNIIVDGFKRVQKLADLFTLLRLVLPLADRALNLQLLDLLLYILFRDAELG